MNNVKNFFNKYLIISSFLLFFGTSLSRYLSSVLQVLMFAIMIFCFVKSVLINIHIYNSNIKRVLYLFLVIIYTTILLFGNSLIYLLFFADLSKL